MLVLLVFDFLVRLLERLAFGAAHLFRHLADQLPVGVIGELRQGDAFAGDALRRLLVAATERGFHRRDIGHAKIVHDLATGSLLFRVELHLQAHILQNLHVPLGFLVIALPFFFQVLVDRALERRLVDFDAALFMLQRLQ